ncbi:MAG: hypothetical protein PHT12_06590 [Patescibacteria group bacterium]|nr:hypothetical protein [Patescibacteria group bacterium]
MNIEHLRGLSSFSAPDRRVIGGTTDERNRFANLTKKAANVKRRRLTHFSSPSLSRGRPSTRVGQEHFSPAEIYPLLSVT